MRVLVVHEEPIVAAGLMAVLGSRSEFSAAAIPCVADLLTSSALTLWQFDVVVADYRTGLELVAEVRNRYRETGHDGPCVLVLTQFAKEWEVRCAVNAGVYGYLLLGCPLDEVLTGVRVVGARRRYMCDGVTERIAESLTRASLTTREMEVLALLQKGMCNKTIARDLGVAPGTIKAHVRGILEKLDSSTRTQAVAVATHRGLIRPGVQQPDGVSMRASSALAPLTVWA